MSSDGLAGWSGLANCLGVGGSPVPPSSLRSQSGLVSALKPSNATGPWGDARAAPSLVLSHVLLAAYRYTSGCAHADIFGGQRKPARVSVCVAGTVLKTPCGKSRGSGFNSWCFCLEGFCLGMSSYSGVPIYSLLQEKKTEP